MLVDSEDDDIVELFLFSPHSFVADELDTDDRCRVDREIEDVVLDSLSDRLVEDDNSNCIGIGENKLL